MATIDQICDDTIKLLPTEDRARLMALILNDLAPEPPNFVDGKEELMSLLLQRMNSPTHPATDETWASIRQEVLKRHERRKSNHAV